MGAMRALLKLSWIELKLFLREPTTLVFTFAFPVVLLFVMGEIFGNQVQHGQDLFRGFRALDYYVPAYVGLVTMSIGVIMLPTRLAAYRTSGVLRRFRASLLPVWAVLGSQVLACLVLSVIAAGLVWAFGEAVFGVRLPAGGLHLAVSFLLSFASFAAIGCLIGAAVSSPRAAQGAGLMLFFVMLFLSGAGPPVGIMSHTMVHIADFLPLTYAVTAIQDAWNGVGWGALDLVVLAAVTMVASSISLRVYRWD